MKKFFLTFVAFLLITAQTAYAHGTFDDIEALQGSTVEIKIPKYEIQAIEGTFEGINIQFYETADLPKFDEPISRAEFLKLMFVNNDFGNVDISSVKDFPDVPETNPYYEYIQKASALGIVHGYEDGFFRPYTTITRGQIAKVLVEAFDPPANNTFTQTFDDVPSTHIFYNHINAAIQAGYFQGYPDGLMRPNRDINFSEAEIVIMRAADPQKFFPLEDRDYFRAFIGIHRHSDLNTKPLKLKLFNPEDEIEEKTININIHYRDVPTISFDLAEDKNKLFSQEDQDKTWAMINEAKSDTNPEQLWIENFIIPTVGELTLGFGDKLYINGRYVGSHFGHDYANIEGTEINASSSGIITLADYTPSFGNTIVIDHGQNVFTMYLHMSELKVSKGQEVRSGQLIGLMGTTGISTGNHLHFTQFIGDIIVNSEEWIEKGF